MSRSAPCVRCVPAVHLSSMEINCCLHCRPQEVEHGQRNPSNWAVFICLLCPHKNSTKTSPNLQISWRFQPIITRTINLWNLVWHISPNSESVCSFFSGVFSNIEINRGVFAFACVWQVLCVTTPHPSSQMGEWQQEQKQMPHSAENQAPESTNDKCLLWLWERDEGTQTTSSPVVFVAGI